jgi:hypothetical protein
LRSAPAFLRSAIGARSRNWHTSENPPVDLAEMNESDNEIAQQPKAATQVIA